MTWNGLMGDEAPLGFDLAANFVQASLGDVLMTA